MVPRASAALLLESIVSTHTKACPPPPTAAQYPHMHKLDPPYSTECIMIIRKMFSVGIYCNATRLYWNMKNESISSPP
jgi:hypothetical protein